MLFCFIRKHATTCPSSQTQKEFWPQHLLQSTLPPPFIKPQKIHVFDHFWKLPIFEAQRREGQPIQRNVLTLLSLPLLCQFVPYLNQVYFQLFCFFGNALLMQALYVCRCRSCLVQEFRAHRKYSAIKSYLNLAACLVIAPRKIANKIRSVSPSGELTNFLSL